jgi:hypothetical protein
MSTLRPSRPARIGGAALALAAVGFVLPAPIASAATAKSGTVAVSVAAKDPATASLRKAKVKVSAVRPASVKRSRWTMPVTGTPAPGATSVDLSGRLKFARGKRNVTVTSLRLTLGKKPAISGKVGKRRITVLTLSGAPKRDAAARTISLENTKTSLSPAAVRILRTKLSTSRVKAGRLGKTTVAVRVAASVPSPAVPTPDAPAPQPSVPAPPGPIDPGGLQPDLPAPPAPEPVCWAPTPFGVTDWIGCGTQTGGNLKSWINYLGTGGMVDATGGAELVTPSNPYDYRLGEPTVTSGVGGRVTITHPGRITYSYPEHFIDMWVENLRLDVAADRASGKVIVDTSYPSFDDPSAPPVLRSNVEVMTVDLAAARSRTTDDGKTTYEMAPASLTADGRTVWSNFYEIGAAFGAFTITVPDAG